MYLIEICILCFAMVCLQSRNLSISVDHMMLIFLTASVEFLISVLLQKISKYHILSIDLDSLALESSQHVGTWRS